MIKGSCFCEQIKFEITGAIPNIYQCHCSECRKTTGSSANAGFFVSKDQYSWLSSKDNITEFTKESGYQVNFCRSCGSPVPNPTSIKPKMMWIPAGLLDNPPDLKVANHLFVDSKASWDEIAGSGKQHAGLPQDIEELL